jgi:hypothetical protein
VGGSSSTHPHSITKSVGKSWEILKEFERVWKWEMEKMAKLLRQRDRWFCCLGMALTRDLGPRQPLAELHWYRCGPWAKAAKTGFKPSNP